MSGSGKGEERRSPAPAGKGRETERTVESRTVFEGRLLRVTVERVRLPDGTEVEREVVRHPGAAAVLPLFTADPAEDASRVSVLLIRQYRHAAGRELWEIPAGTLEPGEGARACAVRELEEEAGLRAGDVRPLGAVHTSPGFTDERVHLFLAVDPEPGEPRPEAEETIRPERMPLSAALAMVEAGEVEDAKTVTALLLAARATVSPSGLSQGSHEGKPGDAPGGGFPPPETPRGDRPL